MPEPRLYRPAWLLRLYVRLEDFGTGYDPGTQLGDFPFSDVYQLALSQAAIAEASLALQAGAAANGGNRSAFTAIATQGEAAAARRMAAKGSQASAAGEKGPGDDYSVEFITVPTEMDIEDKGFRVSAELTASFPFQDMPLDPRIIRECRVEGWVGTVAADDFATSDRWHLRPEDSRTSILRFNGYVDLPEMQHDETSGTIHLKARSYESVLIDGKINARAKAYRINGEGEKITAYINRILEQYPPTSGATGGDPFRARWYASPTEEEPTLDRKTMLRSLQTAASRNAAMGNTSPVTEPIPGADNPASPSDPTGTVDGEVSGSPGLPPKAVSDDGMSIWDLITQACELCGVLPLYQPSLPKIEIGYYGTPFTIDPKNCLLISPPQAFEDDVQSATKIAGGAKDGFQRDFSNGVHSDVRFMVWGHNLKSMKLARKLGKVKPEAVEVRAYNPDATGGLRVMSARFPVKNIKQKKGGHPTKMTEKGSGKITTVKTFVLKGIRDQFALEQAAVALYYQLTRSELTIELETDELASYIDPVASQQSGTLVENHNDNPDLLRLCSGSPVHVTVAQKETEGTDLTICSLSDFYDKKGSNIVELLTKQNDRWGTYSTDGSLDQVKLQEVAGKIQRAYLSAKLPDVFYCRSVKLHFSADDGVSAHMELASYMQDNSPAYMDVASQAMAERRKMHKSGKKAAAKDAAAADTQKMTDKTANATIKAASGAGLTTPAGGP